MKRDLEKHFKSFFAPPKPPCSNLSTQLGLLTVSLSQTSDQIRLPI